MISRKITYKPSGLYEGRKISEYLIEQGYPQSALKRLRHTPGSIWVEKQEVHMNYLLGKNMEFAVVIQEDNSDGDIIPVELPFEILYEDEDILVVNKPADMPIHPTGEHKDNTLANAVEFYCRKNGNPIVFRCMNRLDRDTSGVAIVAKHYLAAGILAGQMRSRRIKREYYAIVAPMEGQKKPLPAQGTVNAGIARQAPPSIERIVDEEKGERAITHYQVIEQIGQYYLIRCVLETGRTHQIRVHMKYLGFPLVGDRLYNPKEQSMARQALHAGRITFVHPILGEEMCIEATMPRDMQEFWWQTKRACYMINK